MICDFCSATPVVTAFKIAEFAVLAVDNNGNAPIDGLAFSPLWACCADCSRLVRSKAWPSLETRMISAHASADSGLEPDEASLIKCNLQKLVTLFSLLYDKGGLELTMN